VICGRFVDAMGRQIPGPMEDRMIAIPLSRLVGLSKGILVVAGLDKVDAAKAAIAGGYVTHLVVGSTVAQALLAGDA
jgi:DNA-binding transcriptional regulator LsrR (DeoR family)